MMEFVAILILFVMGAAVLDTLWLLVLDIMENKDV